MWTARRGSPGTLSPKQCLRLLATPGDGLLNLARHPLGEPVRIGFRLVGHDLVLQPAPVGALREALDEADVTLEVDATDADASRGWHVVVNGRVTSGDGDELVVHPTHVTGFRLVGMTA